MKKGYSLDKSYKELKKLKPKALYKELKAYPSRTLFVSYNDLEYSQRHSKVGKAIFKAVMETSGSYSK